MNDATLIHRWNSATSDELELFSSVREALEDALLRLVFNDGEPEYTSVDVYLEDLGGTQYDGLGQPNGHAITEKAARELTEWLSR